MWGNRKAHIQALPTCINPLPAHGEGGPSLDEVMCDRAAVVSAGTPGQLGRAVRHLLHRHGVWRTRGAWFNRRKRHGEALAHAEAHTGLQNADANVCTHRHYEGNINRKYICIKKHSGAAMSLYCEINTNQR